MKINLKWDSITDATLILEVAIHNEKKIFASDYFKQLVASLHFSMHEDISSKLSISLPGRHLFYIYIERNETPVEEQQKKIMDFVENYNKENNI